MLSYRFADNKSTRALDYEWMMPYAQLEASQTTSPQDYKTTSGCRMMLRYRFANYESTRLQDYEWLPHDASLSLRRLRDYKTTSGCRLGLRCRFADYESTRLQDGYRPTRCLVDSLSCSLVDL